MSALLDHLTLLYGKGHAEPLSDQHTDAHFAPAELHAAAVLIAVTDRAEPGVLLIHRPEGLRSHPGQVAFPGGKLEAGEDAVAAALRETHEELGISPEDTTLIGASDLYITVTGFDVTPVLAVIPPDLPIVPNPDEVASWFEAPLGFLLDPANHIQRSGNWRGETREYLEIVWQDHRIWGVTAAILANLSRRIAWRGLADG